MERTRTRLGVFCSVLLAGLFAAVPSSIAAAPAKVKLCHIPPGNADNPQTITVSEKAVPAHLAHGDSVGECTSGCQSNSECNDGDFCTSDTCQADGTCRHNAVGCDDGNPCTIDSCEPAQGCLNLPDDQAQCDDGNACTANDACLAGDCVGEPIPNCCEDNADCNDQDLCTDDQCIEGVCSNTAKICSLDLVCGIEGLENACVIGACNPSTGACTTMQTSCDDGDICTDDLCDGTVGCFNPSTVNPPEAQEVTCDDGLDNDCDGSVDCVDEDCLLDVACVGPECTDEPTFDEFAQSPIVTSGCIPRQTIPIEAVGGDATICPTQICDGQPGCFVTISFVSGSGDETTGTLLQSYAIDGSGFSADINASIDFTCTATTLAADVDIDADLDLVVDGPYLVVSSVPASSTDVANVNIVTSGNELCSLVDLALNAVLEVYLEDAIEGDIDSALEELLVGNRFCAAP